jgi:hypothetical protein
LARAWPSPSTTCPAAAPSPTLSTPSASPACKPCRHATPAPLLLRQLLLGRRWWRWAHRRGREGPCGGEVWGWMVGRGTTLGAAFVVEGQITTAGTTAFAPGTAFAGGLPDVRHVQLLLLAALWTPGAMRAPRWGPAVQWCNHSGHHRCPSQSWTLPSDPVHESFYYTIPHHQQHPCSQAVRASTSSVSSQPVAISCINC